MSDEEKKAIEILKDREYDFDELYSTFRQSFIKPYDKSIGIILKLIEKQSKEIEELKDTRSVFNMGRRSYKNEIEDKIKAKIEKIDKVLNEDIYAIDGHYDDKYYRYLQDKHILQSLLEKE